MTTPRDIMLSAMATETASWTDAQKAALLHRLDREATRLTVRSRHPTAGALAQSIDPTTRQTAALEKIDEALEWALSTPDARLAISFPPQEGKTTRVGVWGVLRALVQNPDRRCVIASYSDYLARSTARSARNVIRESGTGATDPLTDAPLPDRLGLALADDKSAAGNWKLAGHKGGLYAVGVGGSLTGQPADCVVSDTGIITNRGTLTAAEVHQNPPEYVLGYDHVAGRAAWRRLEATRRIPGRRVITVETENGNVLTCTPDHRVYTSRGYTPAGNLRGRETIFHVDPASRMPEVRNHVHAGESGRAQSDPQRNNPDVLERVRAPINDGEAAYSLLPLRKPDTAQPEGNLLAQVSDGTVRLAGAAPRLPGVRDELSTTEPSHGVLRETVCRPGTLQTDAQRGQLQLQDRNILRAPVSVDAPDRDGTGRVEVRRVQHRALAAGVHQERGGSQPIQSRSASHQRADRGQPAGESDHRVQRVPHGAPQVREDTVRVVRGGGDEAHDVYDLQVEGTRNFFADGLLVHNCLIVDDPIKGMAEADSETEREKVITWWDSVAQTRLAPGAPVVIIQTRWHEADLVGHVLAQDELRAEPMWRVVNIPAVSTPGIADALDRDDGVAMESARGRTLKDFERIRDDVGERVWAALYLGSPTPAQGGLFAQEWFDRHRSPTVPDTAAARLVAVDPAETGKRDEAGIIALTVTPDGRVWVTDDHSGRAQSDEWARRAVLLALTTRAGELSYEAFATKETYGRIIEDAWRRIRKESRYLAVAGGDVVAAAQEYARDEYAPADALAALREVADVPVPDQSDPPFHIRPWRMPGDKTARAAGTRQAASTGRLRMVGTHPDLERQAVQWQSGQSSPDRLDALVQGFERGMALVGSQSEIATPAQVQGAQSPSVGNFWTSTIG